MLQRSNIGNYPLIIPITPSYLEYCNTSLDKKGSLVRSYPLHGNTFIVPSIFLRKITFVASCLFPSQKEITSQTDEYLVILSSKTYVFEAKLTKC